MSQPTPFIQDPDPGFLDENVANGNNGNVTQDNNNSSYIQPDSSLVFITYSFVGTLGVVLNLMVIVGILVNKRMRNVPNMFILNLAVSDLLFSLGVPLIYHSTTAPKWKLGIFLCKLVNGEFKIGFLDLLNRIFAYFPFVPPSLVDACYLHPPNTRAIFSNNDLLFNGTCSVTGGA